MSNDANAIRELVAQWHRATAAGDVDQVLSLMSEDAVFLVAGQPPMTGRATFEKGLRTLLQSHRIESTGEVQEVDVSGDLAYCRSLLHVSVIPLAGGGSHVRSGSTLSVFKRQANGGWQLIRDANLLAAS